MNTWQCIHGLLTSYNDLLTSSPSPSLHFAAVLKALRDAEQPPPVPDGGGSNNTGSSSRGAEHSGGGSDGAAAADVSLDEAGHSARSGGRDSGGEGGGIGGGADAEVDQLLEQAEVAAAQLDEERRQQLLALLEAALVQGDPAGNAGDGSEGDTGPTTSDYGYADGADYPHEVDENGRCRWRPGIDDGGKLVPRFQRRHYAYQAPCDDAALPAGTDLRAELVRTLCNLLAHCAKFPTSEAAAESILDIMGDSGLVFPAARRNIPNNFRALLTALHSFGITYMPSILYHACDKCLFIYRADYQDCTCCHDCSAPRFKAGTNKPVLSILYRSPR